MLVPLALPLHQRTRFIQMNVSSTLTVGIDVLEYLPSGHPCTLITHMSTCPNLTLTIQYPNNFDIKPKRLVLLKGNSLLAKLVFEVTRTKRSCLNIAFHIGCVRFIPLDLDVLNFGSARMGSDPLGVV